MKLDLILENTRNKYNMGLLEESSLSELDVLKGKVMINESTMTIRKMLVEEGTMEGIKSFLEESWSGALYEEMTANDVKRAYNSNTAVENVTGIIPGVNAGTMMYSGYRAGDQMGHPVAGALIGRAGALGASSRDEGMEDINITNAYTGRGMVPYMIRGAAGGALVAGPLGIVPGAVVGGVVGPGMGYGLGKAFRGAPTYRQ